MTTTGGTLALDRPAPAPPQRRSPLKDFGTVLRGAGRVLRRHWPTMLVLFLVAETAREGLMRLSVKASGVNNILGFLIFLLIPLTMLTAFVLMLRVAQPSLSALATVRVRRGPDGQPLREPRFTLLNHIGSVLVPFLAIYATYGMMVDDVSDYGYRVLQEEIFSNADIFDAPEKVDAVGRLPLALTTTMVAVVGAAVVVRWLLSRWEAVRTRWWLGLFGAYVETIWVSLVAILFVNNVAQYANGWLSTRRAVRWSSQTWDSITATLGPLTEPVREVVSYLWGLTHYVDDVIVIPLAWLAVGAVIFGRQLGREEKSEAEVRAEVARRWSRAPRPVRWAGMEAESEARDRFGPLLDSLRLLVRIGLVPMLLFCLGFVLIQQVPAWLWEVERLVVGPADINRVWIPVDAPFVLFNVTVRTMLLAAFLAATVNWLVGIRATRVAAPSTEDGP